MQAFVFFLKRPASHFGEMSMISGGDEALVTSALRGGGSTLQVPVCNKGERHGDDGDTFVTSNFVGGFNLLDGDGEELLLPAVASKRQASAIWLGSCQ